MTPHRHAPASVGLALVAALSLAPAAGAQIAVSANDNKVVSLNGVVTVVPNAPPDTVSVIDLKASPPRRHRQRPRPDSRGAQDLARQLRPHGRRPQRQQPTQGLALLQPRQQPRNRSTDR